MMSSLNRRGAATGAILVCLLGGSAMGWRSQLRRATTRDAGPFSPLPEAVEEKKSGSGICNPRITRMCARGDMDMRAAPPACPFERAPIDSLPWARANHPRLTVDDWNHPIWLTCQSRHGGWQIAALSAGPDGELDTEDDLVMRCGALDYEGMQDGDIIASGRSRDPRPAFDPSSFRALSRREEKTP